jgi:hypothetical protein
MPGTIEASPRSQRGCDVLRDRESGDQEEPLFDLKVEVTSKDISKMREFIQRYRTEENWDSFIRFASTFVRLFPDKKDDYILSTEEFEKLKRWLERKLTGEGPDRDPTSCTYLTCGFLLLYQSEMGSIDLNWLRDAMNKRVKRSLNSWTGYIHDIYHRAMLFPDTVDGLEGAGVFDGIKDYLEVFRDRKSWGTYSESASRVITLFPKHRGEIKRDKEIFESGRKRLERHRKFNQWDAFAMDALDLYVLSSEKSEIVGIGQVAVTPYAPRLMAEPKPLPDRSAA